MGGFLGAGKTTLINKVAGKLTANGRKVAIINNDQGVDLVDTQYSRGKGFRTAEVLGGCFCCRFPDLLKNTREIVADEHPDMVLAEPVGSCTDLQATVVAPLLVLYRDEFTVAPLMVLVDSSRLSSDEIEAKSIGGYLRKHQIEEAEYVVLSKVDMISSARLQEMIDAVKSINPKAPVIAYSAITEKGLDEIVELVASDRRSAGAPVNVDYDTYADAEAELGWYNGQITFVTDRVDTYDLGNKVLRYLAEGYEPQDIAHAKVMIRSPVSAMKMSLIFSNLTTDGVTGSRYAQGDVQMLVNGRVVSSPEKLRSNVQAAVRRAMSEVGVSDYTYVDDCFSPGRPNPTHRMTEQDLSD